MSGGIVITNDNTDYVIRQLGLAKARALEAIGIEAQNDAKAIAPVDTGRLKNSVTHSIDMGGSWAVIGTDVEYAKYVHLGTSRQRAQPFLTDAVTQNAEKYRGIVEDAYRIQ